MSYRRIAEIQRVVGAADDAAAHEAAFVREAERVITELRALIDGAP